MIPHDEAGATRAHIEPVAVSDLINKNDVQKSPCAECRRIKHPAKHDGHGQSQVVVPLPPQHYKYSTQYSVQVKQPKEDTHY